MAEAKRIEEEKWAGETSHEEEARNFYITALNLISGMMEMIRLKLLIYANWPDEVCNVIRHVCVYSNLGYRFGQLPLLLYKILDNGEFRKSVKFV